MAELEKARTATPDGDSNKRISPETEEERAAKKLKTSASERSETESIIAVEVASPRQTTEEAYGKNDEAGSPKNAEKTNRGSIPQDKVSELSPDDSPEIPTVTRKEYEELRTRANALIEKKKERITELTHEIEDLEKENKFSLEKWNEETSIIEQERDKWQAQFVNAKIENDRLAKTQEEFNSRFWEELKKWKDNEISRRVKQEKDKYEFNNQKNQRRWDQKFDTQDRRHQKEKDSMNVKVEGIRTKLRQEREYLQAEIKQVRKEQKKFVQEHKPENAAKMKDLEKTIKEKDKTIKSLQNDTETSRVEVEQLAEEIDTLRKGLQSFRELAAENATRAKAGEENASIYKGRLESLLMASNAAELEHEADLKKQRELWQIQHKNSEQNARRAASNQRTTKMLSHTNGMLIEQKLNLESQLAAAQSEIRRLQGVEASISSSHPPGDENFSNP